MEKRVVFVADRSFNNFDLLSRAAAVAIETFFQDAKSIKFVSLANRNMENLLLQFVDSTRNFLTNKGVLLSVQAETSARPELDDIDLIVRFGDLKYYPYKVFMWDAFDASKDILEFK